MSTALSLEQAPPLSVPLRFFLTAPLFGAASAVLLLWVGPEALQSRWTPAALALTHLFALGALTMVMCGALFQMLPVLVGVKVTRPRLWGGICHVLLVLGTLSLAAGFLTAAPASFRLAVILLAAGLGLFLVVIGTGLLRAPRLQDSVRGMRWACGGLAVTLGFGITLTLGHGWESLPILRVPLTDLHLSWGLLGWVAALIAVVSWQVIPMFQMTPEYPPVLRRWLAAGVLVLLVWFGISAAVNWPGSTWPLAGLALLLIAFAGLTLWLLTRRRRTVGDTNLSYWRLGMVALIAAALLAIAGRLGMMVPGSRLALAPAVLFLAGFALSVVSGMLYKIVPFLVWLHLQQRIGENPAARGSIAPPNMRAVIREPRARAQWWLHTAALTLLLAGLVFPILLRPAALLWLASFAMLGYNLVTAARLYRRECARIAACT
ncbi:MAG: hypothetical protein EPO25_07065 [Gammaproteobacteria bacterium]|nr:MAG: hypothetical protein EPO25_07065 [Gammaproteobacteria bacterium]